MSEEILRKLRESSEPAPSVLRGPGIYALWADDEIVYIGKAEQSIVQRLRSHTWDSKKEFHKFSAISLNGKERIERAEEWLIGKLRPRFNKTIPNGAARNKRLRKTQAPQTSFICQCDCCHELTDDDYFQYAPPGTHIMCRACRSERDLLKALKGFGCLTEEGELTGQLEIILKRHHQA